MEVFPHSSKCETFVRCGAGWAYVSLKHFLGIFLFAFLLVSGCGERGKSPDTGHGRKATAVPKVEPGTELKETDLEAVLKATGARYIVVSIFAPYCGPCLTEAIELAQRQHAWRNEGVAVIGLGLDEPSECRKFLEYTGGRANYPLYSAPWAEKKFSVKATPTILILNPHGESLFSASGLEVNALHVAVDKKLKELEAVSTRHNSGKSSSG